MNNIPILLLLFALANATASAQNNEATLPKTYNKHMVGLNVSNDATSLFSNNNFSDSQMLKAQYGYTAALLYQYRPAKWFSVETGIEYNSTMWYLDDENSNVEAFWDGEGYNPSLAGLLDYGQRINRLAVPLNLRWYYQKGKWNIYALTGLVFAINTTTHNVLELDEWSYRSNDLKNYDLKENFGIGISTGIGAEYRHNKHWIFRIEPRFRVYDIVKPVRPVFPNDDSTIRARPWALGLNLGVYYGFGK